MMNKEKDLAYEEKIKSIKTSYLVTGVVASLIVGSLGFGLGRLLGGNESISVSKDMAKFISFYNSFKNEYYHQQDERVLIDGLYYGLTASVDDRFTFYVSSEKNESQGLSTSQVGIGFERATYYGNALVNHVMSNSPASKARFIDDSNQFIDGEVGLKKGDIIVKIREFDDMGSPYYVLKEHPSSDWSNRFAGSINTNVELVILRDGVTKRCVATRNYFDTDKARLIEKNYSSLKKEAVVQISSFLGNLNNNESTPARELVDIFKNDLLKDNNYIDNLILDLRGNGGGYVLNFSELLSLFTGKIDAYGYYYFPRENKYTPVEAPNSNNRGSIYNYDGWRNFNDSIGHYTLIIDEGTASAAESFVVGLRDYKDTKDKVTIVGEISYGKGIAQSFMYPFASEGDYTSSIRYTSAEVVSMEKNSINQRGIVPDIFVEPKYRSIQDEKLYDYYRKEVKTIDNEYDEAIVLARIEALLNNTFNNVNDALIAYQKAYSLKENGLFDEETIKSLNDQFFKYYHSNPPYNVYTTFVNGDNDIDSFSSIQRKVVKKQIETIIGKSYDNFYVACNDFQVEYASQITDKSTAYNLETAYLLQGKMYEKSVEFQKAVLEKAKAYGTKTI